MGITLNRKQTHARRVGDKYVVGTKIGGVIHPNPGDYKCEHGLHDTKDEAEACFSKFLMENEPVYEI